MPAPQFRETFYAGMGASHVYKTGTASATAASVLAAVTGKQYRLKSYLFSMVADLTGAGATDALLQAAWLADGTTAILGLGMLSGVDGTTVIADATRLAYSSKVITLPSNGVTGTAATAVNIDFTATDARLTYQLDLWYDLI